ncbi:DNA-packaging protein, partial [Vibrio phage 1.052.A._10N.286.46.C3]
MSDESDWKDKKTGQFKKGNRFWEKKSSYGRKPIFENPEELWKAAAEYFTWVEDNPLYEEKAFHHQGNITKTKIAKMRAMTLGGLFLYIDIGKDAFNLYRERPAFVEVCKLIENTIKEQKFTGAAADLLNPAIIARDLGLADKKEVTNKSDIKVTADMSPSDSSNAYQELMGQGD